MKIKEEDIRMWGEQKAKPVETIALENAVVAATWVVFSLGLLVGLIVQANGNKKERKPKKKEGDAV